MKLEKIITLSEVAQAQKDKLCIVPRIGSIVLGGQIGREEIGKRPWGYLGGVERLYLK